MKKSSDILLKNPHYKKERMNHPVYPARVIVTSFLAVIIAGTVLLCMPFSSASGSFTDPLTALFTATTSTCVTGLVLVDTGSYWSIIGQIIILLLIQIGGIGLVTFTTFFIVIFRQKLGLDGMALAQSSTGSVSLQNLYSLLKIIVISTLVIEALGTALLSIRFVPEFGARGLWISLFTAVSAYCNAGIDIFEGEFTSLTAYSGDVLVNTVVMALIIIGGMGFLVFQDVLLYHKKHRLMLHTRVVILTTAVLIVLGALIFFCFEYTNAETFGGLSFKNKILASFFQSVTTRTAGFNTVDFGAMRDPTKLVSCLFMFIGAAPGSTGGGIKVTTFVVIAATVIATFKNRSETVVLHRKVNHGTVYKALSLVTVGILIVMVSAAVIIIETDGISTIDALFEAFSAFGTAGLSAGATAMLGTFSKIAVIITMFIGRVGSFSIFMALSLREQQTTEKTVLPEGQIMVG